jgi:putative PEP-CTERM system TPR-repeat lipoprotein
MNRRRRIEIAFIVATALLAGCADKPEAMLAKAKDQLAKNDRSAAIIQLRNVLQLQPDAPEARFLLGKALYEEGDLGRAETELRKVYELHYKVDEVLPMIARILVQNGEFEKALNEFGNARIESTQGSAELQTALAEARAGTGDVEGALLGYSAALSAKPGYAPAQLGLARLSASSGDIAGAMALVDSALHTDPKLTEGWQFKGEIAGSQGRADDALAAFRKALESNDRFLPAHVAITTILLQQDKIEDAKKQVEALKKVAPQHPQTYYLTAAIALHEMQYPQARDAIQEYLKFFPDNVPGRLLSARINYQLGNLTQAEAELRHVLAQNPKEQFQRKLLIQTYLRMNQPEKALEAIQPIIEEGRLSPDVLMLIGEVYVQSGDVGKAAQYFEKAAALDPKNARSRTAVALAHLARGDAPKGLEELRDAATSDTGITADVALIVGYLQQRNFDAALAAVTALDKKQPNSATVYNLRGGILLGMKDVPGSRASFEKAVALDPTYFPASANLARIDLAENKPQDAQKRFEAVLAKDPKNVQALLALANMRAQAGAPSEEVAKLIGRAVAAAPENPNARTALIAYHVRAKELKLAVTAAQDALTALPNQPEVIEAAAEAYVAAGDTKQAVTTYQRWAQLQPDSPIPYVRIAQLDVKAGRAPAALATAREIQKQRPTAAIGYIIEGDIYTQAREWAYAAAAYRNGLTKVNDSSELATRLAVVLEAGGSVRQARQFAATWVNDHPQDIPVRHVACLMALNQKDYASAASQYKALLEIQPNDVQALNNLAWASGQIRDPKAIEYAEKARSLAPDNATVLDTLAVLLIDKGDTKQSIELLRRAVTLAPNTPSIRLNFARALVKDGQKASAKQELQLLSALGDKFNEQAEVARLLQGL